MRAENGRLGVEATTRSDLTARSATKPRPNSSIVQWRTARPERNRLEKSSRAVQGWGAAHRRSDSNSGWIKVGGNVTANPNWLNCSRRLPTLPAIANCDVEKRMAQGP